MPNLNINRDDSQRVTRSKSKLLINTATTHLLSNVDSRTKKKTLNESISSSNEDLKLKEENANQIFYKNDEDSNGEENRHIRKKLVPETVTSTNKYINNKKDNRSKESSYRNSDKKSVTNSKRALKKKLVIDSDTSSSSTEDIDIQEENLSGFENKTTFTGDVSPPKQRRIENNENEVLSPSSLFKKLQLSSPTSIKNENVLKPKNNSASSQYQSARKALHSAVPTKMPGREKEIEELESFIFNHLANKTAGSLYVSGPPGTGKTASLMTILEMPEVVSQLKQIYINCTAIKSSSSVFSNISKKLNIEVHGKTEKDYIQAIERYLMNCKKMVVFVLDEIDQLESKNQSVLYTIFEWPSLAKSQLILIGIANALDLTDRMLPRLHSRCEMKPQLMHFTPYSKVQIVEIFKNRLLEGGVLDLFSPVALQMLAGKVAATSGDVRRALDIGRRVVEIVEQHKNGAEEGKSNIVDLKHVMDVLNIVYGTTNNLTKENDDSFPLQQKIVVCTLLLVLKKARNKNITVGKLHEVYRKVCTKRNLLAVDQSEFAGLCSLIETRGIIKIGGKKDSRLQKINLEWDQEEVQTFLKDKQLMSHILQDESVLGKM